MIPVLPRNLAGALLAVALVGPRALPAQEAALVEGVAPLLEAEDARQFAERALVAGVQSTEPVVRRAAATAIGRIGDWRGTPLLVPMLQDQDSTVQPVAAFALGLLRDPAAVAPLISRLEGTPAPTLETAREILSALCRIGGPEAGDLIGQVLGNTASIGVTSYRDVLVRQAALDAWRLGPDAPVSQLLALAEDDDDELRWRVIFALGQLRAPAAGPKLLTAIQSEHPVVRAYAARALTAGYVSAAGLETDAAVQLLARAARDEQAAVRTYALRSLGTFRQAGIADQVVPQLSDPMPNVQVAAAATLGQSGGPVAVAQLSRIVREQKGSFALQREALLGLARVGADSFRTLAGPWGASPRWPERATAAEGWGWVAPGAVTGHPDFLADADGRVVEAALQGWLNASAQPDSGLVAAARGLLAHPDVGVRSVAAEVLAQARHAADIAALAAAFRRAERDSVPDAALAALRALHAIAESSAEDEADVARDFLASAPRPDNYVMRAWAEANWPAAAERWGAAYPISTGRTRDDYREVARRFIVTPESPDAHPHVFLETEQRVVIEVELFGPEAPLTVVNFLTLLDRRYFDRNRWFRVIPGVAARSGDPRGDGYGGPGYAIRDEWNPRRFDGYVLAMANAQPDAGGSQWFLTLGSQPQFDGSYTVFGRLVGSPATLLRVTQGDQIRLIRR